MRIRPKVVEGDLVRFSKRGKHRMYMRDIPSNRTMVILRVEGDGIDRSSILRVRIGLLEFNVYRNDVWKTGFNVYENNTPELILDEHAPINNEGRDACYICHMPTKEIPAFSGYFKVCGNENCKWFEN